MKKQQVSALMGAALLAGAIAPARAADDPKAVAILRQMSDKLSAARQFSFECTRSLSSTRDPSRRISFDIDVVVRRPKSLAAVSTSKLGTRRMSYDGATLTMYDQSANTYAQVATKQTLDTLPAALAAKFDYAPPIAEFIITDPASDVLHRTSSVKYAGTAMVGTPPVACHRLVLGGSLADATLLVGVDDSLPRKLGATVKSGVDGGAQVAVFFRNWNLQAEATDATFAFTPPEGALKIPMVTTQDIKARKKAAGR